MKWWTDTRRDGERCFKMLLISINGEVFEVGGVNWFHGEPPFYSYTQGGRGGPMSTLREAADSVERNWFADLRSVWRT